jgi:hypothetical protein
MIYGEHGGVAEWSQPPRSGVQACADQDHLRPQDLGQRGGYRLVDRDGPGDDDLGDRADRLGAHPGRGPGAECPAVVIAGPDRADRGELLLA